MLLCTAAISSGCLVLALQPAYDAESVAFDEALVGQWENTDDGAKAVIERGEWRSYKITYTDRFATRTFQSNLTKIGAAAFLDLTEMRGADPGPFLVPVHGVFRVAVSGNTLTASPLDYAWFMRAMTQKAAGNLGTLSVAIDDRRNIVMTAPTTEIRRWLARAPDAAFGATMTFMRQRHP
ncbi:MAG TPA: hypothetical protein VGJ39_16170 [Vicinamibacterales bacterium]|jgi:hypothetical protein